MPTIFISYRRDGAPHAAGRLYDRLANEFGRDLLFMDIDTIPLGSDFHEVLGNEVGKCGVLLAVVDPQWLSITKEDGSRRLDDPNDFVRIEIAAALARGIPVVPILLDGTKIPKATELPDNIRALSSRHGLEVRATTFHVDVAKLINGLRRLAIQLKPSITARVARWLAGEAAHLGAPRNARSISQSRDQAPNSAIMAAIVRIHEASQVPPLSPAEYRLLFQLIAKEISANDLLGARTLTNIALRAQQHDLEVRLDDVRFVIEVVAEPDPWFEQGVSADLFAGRFRNFVVARCRGEGLNLSADDLDLIDAWFNGAARTARLGHGSSQRPEPKIVRKA